MSLVSPLAPGLSLSPRLPIYLSTPAALDKPGGTTLQARDKLAEKGQQAGPADTTPSRNRCTQILYHRC